MWMIVVVVVVVGFSSCVFFICLILIRWDWASLLHGSTVVGHLTVAAFWCDWFRYLCLWLPFKCFTHCHTLVIFNVIIFELRVCKCCTLAFSPLIPLLHQLRVLFIAKFHSITCMWLKCFFFAPTSLLYEISASICSFQFDCLASDHLPTSLYRFVMCVRHCFFGLLALNVAYEFYWHFFDLRIDL